MSIILILSKNLALINILFLSFLNVELTQLYKKIIFLIDFITWFKESNYQFGVAYGAWLGKR